MKLIKLTKGFEAIVDSNMFDYLSQFNWHASGNYTCVYAARRLRDETRQMIFMHHDVLDINPHDLNGKQVDHINRNKLDNRLANLRIVSALVNAQNSDRVQNQKGISIDRTHGTFKAYINFEMRPRLNVGTYKTYEEAYSARQQKLEELGIQQC